MESTPWSLTTSANSAALVDSPDWARLRNAVREPVREMIAVEIDTEARARAVIAEVLAIAPSRPHHVLEFDAARAEPGELLAAAGAATAGWPSEQGLLFVLDTSRPRPGEDDARATAFWEGMNSLREQWDALDCQTLFLLLPYHYRLLSSAASHLKRWISLKAHLFPGGAARSGMESASAQPQQRAIGLLVPAEGRRALAALEEQLREALRRGEPPSTLVRRYYLPMFAAAVSTGDVARAQRVRKKLEAAEIPESELPGWLNVSFNFELAQYRLEAARETAERHLRWAQERNDLREEAAACFNLGRLAQKQRDFAGAEPWYLKSLAIFEKQGDEHGAAMTYGNLGLTAEEQRDFAGAERWYLKSLAVFEKQGDEHSAAMTYHNLGTIAQERRDFAGAERWFLSSLGTSEKQGDEHGAAMTYHQLGMIAEEQRDLARAERWYLKSLAIEEKQGNKHGAASTCNQLGKLALGRGDHLQSGELLLKAFSRFAATNDQHFAGVALNNFAILLRRAPPTTSEKLRALGLKTLGPELMGQIERAVKDGEKA